VGDERIKQEMFAIDLRSETRVAVISDFHSFPF
jgi:hypothetical protein